MVSFGSKNIMADPSRLKSGSASPNNAAAPQLLLPRGSPSSLEESWMYKGEATEVYPQTAMLEV